VDYSLTGTTNGIGSAKESMKDKYSGFKVTFLRDVAASKDSPVTISYVMKFHNEVLEEDDPQITGYWLKTPFVSNYFNVYYPSGDDLTAALDESKGADYCWSSDLPYNVPLTKSNGT
jgi:hypothetical protein